MNRNTYLNCDPDFDGLIVYHNLDGTFSNGWKYVKGKIVTSLIECTECADMISYRAVPASYEVLQSPATRSGGETIDGGELPGIVIIGDGGGSGGGIAAGGSEYVVYVNDRTAFTSFCNNSSNSEFTETASGGLFKSGTQWANTYEAAKTKLTQQGYSQNDAQSYALSYVLDHYDTGIKIYQKKNGAFKEQRTTKTNNNYNPQICQ
jgi:hypothetical protein